MKKVLMMAAAAAMLFAGCAKETGTVEKVYEGSLTLKVNKATTTRSVGAGTQDGAQDIDLDPAKYFVVIVAESNGNIRNSQVVPVANLETSGVMLNGQYATSDHVYALANLTEEQKDYLIGVNGLPGAASPDNDVTDIFEGATKVWNITEQTDFTKVILGNTNTSIDAGANAINLTANDYVLPAATATAGQLEANLSIMPLVSRLEVGQIGASTDGYVNGDGSGTKWIIESFEVTGVFVDNFYNQFTFGGEKTGSFFSLGAATGNVANFTNMGATYPTYADVKATPADLAEVATAPGNGMLGVAADYTANAASPAQSTGAAFKYANGNMFGYNVVSRNIPHVVIRFKNIKLRDEAGVAAATTIAAPRYIVVTGYQKSDDNSMITEFERGKVYRLGVGSKMNFDVRHITETPFAAPENDLTVKVQVLDWVPVDNTPIFQ